MVWIGCVRCENFRRDFVARNSLDRFAPSFVRQLNGPECTKIVRNAPNYKFWKQCGDWMCKLRKILTRLRGTNFSTSSTCCAPSFRRQPNSPEFTQIV